MIALGAPLYLAVDRSLVGHLARDALGLDASDDGAVQAFNNACFTLLDRSDCGVGVRDAAFVAVRGTPGSSAICLAAQQVLAVELMRHERGGYSENAYFPRYRELLGLADRSRSNPISNGGFQLIWKTLREDILRVPGARMETITFKPGHGRVNLNRNLPLTQALLTIHDLTEVLTKRPSLTESATASQLSQVLRDVRRHLGDRARGLVTESIANAELAQRLCDQLKAFLTWQTRLMSELRPGATTSQQTGTLVAFLERGDPFSWDGDSLTFYLETGAEPLRPEEDAFRNALGLRFSKHRSVTLAAHRDGYRELGPSDALDETGGLVVIVPAGNGQWFVSMARQRYCAEFSGIRSNLPDTYAAYLCNAGNLQLAEELGRGSKPRALDLQGGLLLDARSRIYLAGYPPTAVLRRGSALRASDSIIALGRQRQVGAFLEELRAQRGAAKYLIKHGNDSVEFDVVPARPETDPVPFVAYVIADGQLAPVATKIAIGGAYLRGTSFFGISPKVHLSDVDLGLLLEDGARVVISPRLIARLLGELRSLGEGDVRARLAARRVLATRSVPVACATSGLLRRLQASQTSGS